MTTKKTNKPSPSKKPAPSKSAAEKPVAEKAMIEKSRAKAPAKGSEKPSEKSAPVEKATIEKSEKSSPKAPSEHKTSVEKSAHVEKHAVAEKATEKAAAAEKVASEKAAAKAAAEEKLIPPKSKLTKDEMKQFKAALLEIRAKLAHQVGAMEGEALKEGESEVSVDHMADHGTETFAQDFTLSLIENEEATIREIDGALERINDGTYGMCEPCIDETLKLCKTCPHIPKMRLEAIPYTRFCVEYARVAEREREVDEYHEEEEE